MFLVQTRTQWKSMDKKLYLAAGRGPDKYGSNGKGHYNTWRVKTIDEAADLRKRLAAIPGVIATLREE